MGRIDTRRRLLVVLAVGVLCALSVVIATSSLARPAGKQAARDVVRAETGDIAPVPAAAPQGQEGARVAAAAQCYVRGAFVNYYNGSGKLLARFEVRQKWCFDFNTITFVGKPQINPIVTSLGKASNWKYEGLVEKSGKFVTYDGRPYGSHVGIRQGNFSYKGAQGNAEKFPYTKLVKYYNGGGFNVIRE